MAAPEYVPTTPLAKKHYASPPQRSSSWRADRPGETVGDDTSTVGALGSPGPDQGYAMTLTSVFDSRVVVAENSTTPGSLES